MKRILISIKLNESIIYRIKDQMSMSQVQYVYAPTHRSYLDFILLSYILFSYDMALPNIASGMDFYHMKIVGELLRQTGAFYMRRSFSSDHLYKEIFRAYVNSLVAHSDRAIEFFIEGTRSRSQKTLPPKFGK
jgi:glycerone phosphate O-acyltransferase